MKPPLTALNTCGMFLAAVWGAADLLWKGGNRGEYIYHNRHSSCFS